MPQPFITLSPDQIREVETLAALLSQDQIADCFGICRNTFRAIRAREPEFDANYKRGKAKAIAHVANGLLQKARAGCKTSSIFYLKTQAGWRETAEMAHVVEPDGDATGARDKLKEFIDNIAARSARIGVDSTDRQLEAVIADGEEGRRCDRVGNRWPVADRPPARRICP